MTFLYGNWLRLSIITRQKIANQFGVKKIGPTHVFDNVVQSDGYAIKDVEASLTPDIMRLFVGVDEKDTDKLWNLFIDKIEGKTILAKEEEKIISSLNKPTVVESTTLTPKHTEDELERIKSTIVPLEKPKKNYYKSKKNK